MVSTIDNKLIRLHVTEEAAIGAMRKAIQEGYDEITIVLDRSEMESWRKTVLLRHLSLQQLIDITEELFGDRIFQGTQPEAGRFAHDLIVKNLKRAVNNPFYTDIPDGLVLLKAPTRDDCVDRLTAELRMARTFYQRYDDNMAVTDVWADAAGKRNCARDVEKMDCPRFSGTPISEEDHVASQAERCDGLLAEGFVVAHMNTCGLGCPECGERSSIGLIGGSGVGVSGAFRDAVCMACKAKGVDTLFEIKTRWEKAIAGKDSTYAGDFVALNALFAKGANIYLVVASRDTGVVRVGKVTFAFFNAQERFLHAIQQQLGWGSPGSSVKCNKGLHLMEAKMEPLMVTLSKGFCEGVAQEALKIIESDVKVV